MDTILIVGGAVVALVAVVLVLRGSSDADGPDRRYERGGGAADGVILGAGAGVGHVDGGHDAGGHGGGADGGGDGGGGD